MLVTLFHCQNRAFKKSYCMGLMLVIQTHVYYNKIFLYFEACGIFHYDISRLATIELFNSYYTLLKSQTLQLHNKVDLPSQISKTPTPLLKDCFVADRAS